MVAQFAFCLHVWNSFSHFSSTIAKIFDRDILTGEGYSHCGWISLLMNEHAIIFHIANHIFFGEMFIEVLAHFFIVMFIFLELRCIAIVHFIFIVCRCFITLFLPSGACLSPCYIEEWFWHAIIWMSLSKFCFASPILRLSNPAITFSLLAVASKLF